MDKSEEFYCPPEIINAFFEEFPLNGEGYIDHQYMFSSQDADVEKKCSEIKNVKLESNLRANSMDFKCNLPRLSENSQSMQPFLSDEMETDVSRDHQLYLKNTNSVIEKPTTFETNDTVIDNTSIGSMSDVTNDILNKYVHPVPHYAENKNLYFTRLTNDNVEDQNNKQFSVFYYKRNTGKSVGNQMNKLLHSKSTSLVKSEEIGNKCSTSIQNKCKQRKKLNAKRRTWQNPYYSFNINHLANDQFINNSNFLSLMAKGTPAVLMKPINENTAITVCSKLTLTADMPFVYLHGQLSVANYNKNIKYENILQYIKLTKLQLRKENSLKTQTSIMMDGSDVCTQKYQINNANNNLVISTIKIQQKSEKCMKCIHEKESNDYEGTVEYEPEKYVCFNHTKPMNVKKKNSDKRQNKLTFLLNPTICPNYNIEMQNFWEMILKTFENNFQTSKISIYNGMNVINATPNTRNTSNSSHHRNDAGENIADICNTDSNKIFVSLQDKESSPQYTILQHELHSSSSNCHIISFPVDSDDNFSKISPVQQISCSTSSIECDTVVDHDLMNLVDKEVDLSFKQHENNSLQLWDKNSLKEVECQTDLSLNCNTVYKYQHSDPYNVFKLSNAYKLPGIYHKRENVQVSVDNAIPAKRRCSSNVSEYQEADIIKWKIERYLSTNADETNQIVPDSVADEGKYEFNSMELYGEAGVLKDVKDITAYNSNEINSVKSTNEITSSHKSLNYINNRRPLRLGLSRRANTKRLHSSCISTSLKLQEKQK